MSITTFDYVPKIILGKTGNYLFNSINLFTRAIAFYIYFKTSDELDILEIILAYVFPIIYILYKISQENADYIAGLFSFKKTSGERCIERRGADVMANKHGDKKSIPEDAAACGDVVLDTINTANECQAVASVGDPDDRDMYPTGINACLYIPKEDDEGPSYKTYKCNIHQSETRCNSHKDDDNSQLCRWRDINADGDCSTDKYLLGSIGVLGESDCPRSCQYSASAPTTVSLAADGVPAGSTITFSSDIDTELAIHDTLTLSNAAGLTCDVNGSFTITGISGAVATVSQVIPSNNESAAHTNCVVTRTPGGFPECKDTNSDDAASNGGLRRGICINN